MQTRTSTTFEPYHEVDLAFSPVNPAAPGARPTTSYLQVEDTTSFYQKTTESEKGPRSQWKSFQNFKSFRGKPNEKAVMYLYACHTGYPPDYDVAQSSEPTLGYYSRTWGGYVVPYGDAGRLDSGLPGFDVPQPDGGFVPPPANIDLLVANSLRVMLPLIKAELSLLNSVYELKDFKHMAKSIVSTASKKIASLNSLLRTGKSTTKRLPRWVKDLKSLTPAKLLRLVSSGFLEYSFNLAPLVSDIQHLIAAIKQTQARINDLTSRSGKRQSKHYNLEWIEFTDVHDPEVQRAFWSWQYQDQDLQTVYSSRDVLYKPTMFHAQVEYNFNYTALQLANAQLFGLLDSLGINLNPAIIWNAIPYSFLVDWVLGVSKYLDTLKEENMRPQINIHRYLWSVKRERTIIVTKGLRSSVGMARQTSQMPVVTQTAYRRQVMMPDISSVLQTSGLSLHEITLGAAMVVSRRRRRRR